MYNRAELIVRVPAAAVGQVITRPYCAQRTSITVHCVTCVISNNNLILENTRIMSPCSVSGGYFDEKAEEAKEWR